MKKIILLSLLSLTTAVGATEAKIILDCHEKFSSLTITQKGEVFEIERSMLLDRVKGTLYIRGGYSLEATGEIYAKSVKASSNHLTFTLDEGKFLNIDLVQGSKLEILNVKISSNTEFVADQLNELLNVSEYELQFDDSEACKIIL